MHWDELTHDQKTRVAQKAPRWVAKYHPVWMAFLWPDWMADFAPERISNLRPAWMRENRPEKYVPKKGEVSDVKLPWYIEELAR